MLPIRVAHRGREVTLSQLPTPLDLDTLLPGDGDWEIEIGFGKGRYLLERSAMDPGTRFLGIELVSKYYRRVRDRVEKRGLDNVLLLRGEAQYLISVALPRAFARVVHVYFPDPWPKSRHQKRRLFDAETVDLVLGLLVPGGHLYFATDYLEYGDLVQALLDSHPVVAEVRRVSGWHDGARTNYEAKYEAEGRGLVRLVVTRRASGDQGLLHPAGRTGIVVACS